MKPHKTDRILTESKHARNKSIQQPAQPCQPHQEDFDQLLQEIKSKIAVKQFSRHTKVRLQAWLFKLHRAEINKIWQHNRKMYLKLLNLMIDCEYICHPFLSFPPKDTLQIMQKHQVDQIIGEVQRAVKLNRVQSGKHSHFAEMQKTPYEMQNQKDVDNSQHQSHRKVSVSNDSIRTLSVSQQMRKQLRKKGHSTLSKKVQPKFIKTVAPFRLHANVQECSFETSKFGELVVSSDNVTTKIQKRNKKSSSLITEALNKENNSKLISEQLKKYADSLSPKAYQSNNFTSLLQSKKTNKQVLFMRSPRFNMATNNWSQRGEVNQKLFTQRKYWQSNSLAQAGTPRYLNFYPSHPYPSLSLSSEQQEGINTTRSKQNCCSNCLLVIWPSH